MGIHHLLPELKQAMTKCHIKDMAGQVAAVDVSGWIHKGEFNFFNPKNRFIVTFLLRNTFV